MTAFGHEHLRAGFHYYLRLKLVGRRGVRLPLSECSDMEDGLDFRLLNLLAEVIACCEVPPEAGPGHPRSETVRVLAKISLKSPFGEAKIGTAK